MDTASRSKAGRFLSSIGYLNDQHSHTWDFVNQPLAYQAFLGGQFADDGLQLKWLAPTDIYLQFGAEVGSGLNFPGSDRATNGAESLLGVICARRWRCRRQPHLACRSVLPRRAA